MHFKDGQVSVLPALVKGTRLHDMRDTIRRRGIDRDSRAAIGSGSRER